MLNFLKDLFAKEEKNPVVVRTIHTAWQAGLGVIVANLSHISGANAKGIVIAAVAAAAAVVKNVIVQAIGGTKPAA